MTCSSTQTIYWSTPRTRRMMSLSSPQTAMLISLVRLAQMIVRPPRGPLALLGSWLTSLAVEAMKELVLPPLEAQPPILHDVYHTWEIPNWRQEPRRGHGPIFEAGGYPW